MPIVSSPVSAASYPSHNACWKEIHHHLGGMIIKPLMKTCSKNIYLLPINTAHPAQKILISAPSTIPPLACAAICLDNLANSDSNALATSNSSGLSYIYIYIFVSIYIPKHQKKQGEDLGRMKHVGAILLVKTFVKLV